MFKAIQYQIVALLLILILSACSSTPKTIVRKEFDGNNYYWLEAENMVPENQIYGSAECREQWTRQKCYYPNDSMAFQLSSPQNKAAGASVETVLNDIKPGKYNVWIRLGAFKPYGPQGVTVALNEQKQTAMIEKPAVKPSHAFKWQKLSRSPINIKDSLTIKLWNDVTPEKGAKIVPERK